MDALKRAEASKQEAARRQGGEPAADAGLSLEPIAPAGAPPIAPPIPPSAAPPVTPTPADAASPLPDLASHLELVDAELARSAPPPPPLHAFRPEPPPPQAAPGSRNAFAVKEQPAGGARRGLWLFLGFLGLAALGIGGYFWVQLNSLNQGKWASPAASTASPSTIRPAAPPPAARNDAPPRQPLSPPLPVEEAPPPPPVSQEPPPRPEAPPLRARPTPPIQIARAPVQPDADLLQAHAQLRAGDLQQARQLLLQALKRDPNNTDTLLALAAVAHHQGRFSDAEEWRQRALIADPGDPAAQAAALSSRAAGGDMPGAESRLKTLLAAQPQSAELNFALGNLYARQQRWPEAQQHYFNAVAADVDNPDYLFNLAVSLDQMRQSAPAARYYRLALEAAAGRPAAFDAGQARRRLADLQP